MNQQTVLSLKNNFFFFLPFLFAQVKSDMFFNPPHRQRQPVASPPVTGCHNESLVNASNMDILFMAVEQHLATKSNILTDFHLLTKMESL